MGLEMAAEATWSVRRKLLSSVLAPRSTDPWRRKGSKVCTWSERRGAGLPLGSASSPALHVQLPGPITTSLPTPSSAGTRPGHALEMLWNEREREHCFQEAMPWGKVYPLQDLGLLGLQLAPLRWGGLLSVGFTRAVSGVPSGLSSRRGGEAPANAWSHRQRGQGSCWNQQASFLA